MVPTSDYSVKTNPSKSNCMFDPPGCLAKLSTDFSANVSHDHGSVAGYVNRYVCVQINYLRRIWISLFPRMNLKQTINTYSPQL